MNADRAREILNAAQTVKVEVNGIPVWIEAVDASSQTVRVHDELQPNTSRTVRVDQLQEVH